MEEAWLEAVTAQLGSLEQQTRGLKEKLEQLPDYSQALQTIEQSIDLLKSHQSTPLFPQKGMEELERSLRQTTFLLRQPRTQEVIHHHHVPKLIWIFAGLFLLFCLVCSGWYNTHNKLNNSVANDTKYRYLKLNDNRNLQVLLAITDSLYSANNGMRDSVIRREEENERKLELLQEATAKQKEADELRKKAKSH